MILFSYDIESTGLNVQEDDVIEIGGILWSTNQSKSLESTGFLVKSTQPISEEITKITGITQSAIDKFGYEPKDALDNLIDLMSQADAVIGHNVRRFDKRMSEYWASRHGKTLPNKLWMDTMTDIPQVMGEQLVTMAGKHGFVNLFPHSALADAQSVLKLISGYDIDQIVERAKSPLVVLQSHQARGNNADAKKFKFRWNPDLKIWWKAVKEMDIEELAGQAPFNISRLGKEVSLEQLED